MNFRVVYALMLCLAFAPCFALAAGVEGQVINPQTNEPVANAKVTIGGRTTKTDGGGYFVLSVNPGTQAIRVNGRECHPPNHRVDPQRRNWVTITCQ